MFECFVAVWSWVRDRVLTSEEVRGFCDGYYGISSEECTDSCWAELLTTWSFCGRVVKSVGREDDWDWLNTKTTHYDPIFGFELQAHIVGTEPSGNFYQHTHHLFGFNWLRIWLNTSQTAEVHCTLMLPGGFSKEWWGEAEARAIIWWFMPRPW